MNKSNGNLKILLVEDNSGDARLIEELLKEDENTSFQLSHASRLDKGLNYLNNLDFDLILLDLHLEDSDGIRTFKIMDKSADLPIIILTGLSDENFAVEAIELGAQDYLVKDQLDSQLLVRSIKYAIERKKALVQKELLLKEIHHRVKNNLMIISSLLNLQTQYIKDDDDLELFRESKTRTDSMAIIHEYLYQSHDFRRINFGEYLKRLTSTILSTYNTYAKGIKLNMDIDDDVMVDVDTAIPLGLIVNELVSNSLKHAFPQGTGEITLKLKATGDKFTFIIKDDGIGIPLELDLQKITTLGLQLVNNLTSQLDSEFEVERCNGTQFTFKNLKCNAE